MAKQTYYFKFINPIIAELLQPGYFTDRFTDEKIETQCPRCGDILYLPIETEIAEIAQAGPVYTPLPAKDFLHTPRGEPLTFSVGFFYPQLPVSYDGYKNLVSSYANAGLMLIDEYGYMEILVYGVSKEPIRCETCAASGLS